MRECTLPDKRVNELNRICVRGIFSARPVLWESDIKIAININVNLGITFEKYTKSQRGHGRLSALRDKATSSSCIYIFSLHI